MKGCIFFIWKKEDLGTIKNYWHITLTAITAKIYNALLLNHIWCADAKVLRKKSKWFSEKSIHNFRFWLFIESLDANNLEATLVCECLGENLLQMQQILLVLCFSKRNCYYYSDTLHGHKGCGLLTWWWRLLLWHGHWRLARRYIGVISIPNLPRLYTTNIIRLNSRKWFHTKNN